MFTVRALSFPSAAQKLASVGNSHQDAFEQLCRDGIQFLCWGLGGAVVVGEDTLAYKSKTIQFRERSTLWK